MARRVLTLSIVAPALLATAMLARPAPAVAECFSGPIRADEQPRIGYAFIAHVTEASTAVDPVEGMAAYDWHVELSTERTYVGSVPPSLVYNGWEHGCHDFRGDGLHTGETIFVATQHLHLQYLPGDPFDGDVLVWRWDGDAWAFYAEAMSGAEFAEYYPKAARTATTTREILAMVSAGGLPDTSTVGTPTFGPDHLPAPLALVLGLVALLGTAILVRLQRRTRDIRER